MTGTFLNVATVIVGGSIGALAGERLPEKYRQTAMQAIGLMTLLIGLQMALGMKSAIIVLGSVVLGSLAGEALRIDDGLDALGRWVERRVSGFGSQVSGDAERADSPPNGNTRNLRPETRNPMGAISAESTAGDAEGGSLFSKGFVTASLIFCVGPMTILGSFQDGLTGVYDTLAVKSALDGFAALALA
ncbi:MAG: DUF554 domain-containing protein, partial [Planctomycetaceae bacterium]